jgi:uncharacterized membrane protein required for colicin V production
MGYIGFRLGLGTELLKLAGLTAGFFAGFRYYQQMGDWLAQRTFLSVEWGSVAALALIVVAVYLAVTRASRLLEKLVQVNFEKKVNQIGGLLAGLGRGLLVSSVVLVACQQLPAAAMQESIREHSLSGPVVSRMAPAVYDCLRALPRRALARLGVE